MKGLSGLSVSLKKNRTWRRADVDRLKELANQKSNKELAEIFGVSISVIVKAITKYEVKRNPEFLKELMSHKKENHPKWKGGLSKNNYHYKKLQKERYPERVQARDLLKKAIERGEIIRKPCEHVSEDGSVCGYIHTHGHHEDYSKPLDVIWLCRKHHRERHGGTH